jgi:hypothetical protein
VHWARSFSVAEIRQVRDQHRRALEMRFSPHRALDGDGDPRTEGGFLLRVWEKLSRMMKRPGLR